MKNRDEAEDEEEEEEVGSGLHLRIHFLLFGLEAEMDVSFFLTDCLCVSVPGQVRSGLLLLLQLQCVLAV